MAEVGEVSSAECPEKLAQINIYQYLRKLFSFRADFQRTSDGRGVRMEFRVYAAYQGCEQKPRKRGTPCHSGGLFRGSFRALDVQNSLVAQIFVVHLAD